MQAIPSRALRLQAMFNATQLAGIATLTTRVPVAETVVACLTVQAIPRRESCVQTILSATYLRGTFKTSTCAPLGRVAVCPLSVQAMPIGRACGAAGAQPGGRTAVGAAPPRPDDAPTAEAIISPATSTSRNVQQLLFRPAVTCIGSFLRRT